MLFKAEKPQESAAKRASVYAAVFFVTAAVYAYVEAGPYFRDPDSFYHLKMAMLLMQRGIVRSFPWLPFTTLAHDFADHHFLYHVLLIPFVRALGPFPGMTAATVFFAALAMTLFYALLRVHGVRHAWVYVFVLATSSAFAFRINLAKTSALSISFLFMTLIAMRKDRPLALFVIAWLYVLLYGGWPIMAVVAGVFLATRVIIDALSDRHPVRSWAGPWFWKRLLGGSREARKELFAAREARQAAAIGSGLVCGIVFNPYFPANIRFYWDQIVQIALVGHRDQVGVGSEWYPFAFPRLLSETSGVFMLALLAAAFLAVALCWPETLRRGTGAVKRSEATPIAAAWMLAGLFFAMTLQSQRHVEYFAPFAAFAGALLADALLKRFDLRATIRKLGEIMPKPEFTVPFAAVYLCVMFLYVGVRDVGATRSTYLDGVPWGKFSGAAAWLSTRAKPGSVVLHSNWDEFPMLFYGDDKDRYIVGLDPTFLYLQDPVRYRLWVDLTTGKVPNGAAAMAKRVFGARYVLIARDHQAMLDEFEGDPKVIPVYKDGDAQIFTLL